MYTQFQKVQPQGKKVPFGISVLDETSGSIQVKSLEILVNKHGLIGCNAHFIM